MQTRLLRLKVARIFENYFLKAIEHFFFVCIASSKQFALWDNYLKSCKPETQSRVCITLSSPVPELSFLPAPYRGSTQAGERRVQDKLHAHAQNAAIFSPEIGGKTIFGSTFQIWLVARFSE